MSRRKRSLLSILAEDDGPFCGPLYCPRCGAKRVHPISVSVNPAGEYAGKATIKASGLHLDRTARPLGISTRIVLTFGCEPGHVWAVDFTYARGETDAGLLHPSDPKPGDYRVLTPHEE